MRLAGMVLLGKGWPVKGSRTCRREHARPLGGRRDARDARDPAGDARALVIDEEERPVLDEGAAQVAAELVLVVGRLRLARPLREEVVRVQRVVAEVVVGGAVELVGARLGGDADGGARRASVLGRVGRGHDLELLDGVDGGARHLGGQLLHVGGDAVVVDAVQQEVVLQRAGAVDVDPPGAAERGAAALLREAVALRTRHERQQVVPVADRERELRHGVLVDHGPERRLVAQQVPRFLHHDALGQRPDGEREVQARALTDLEDDRLGRGLESGRLGLDPVASGRQVHHLVGAARGRLGAGRHVGVGVGGGDGAAGHDGAASVLHDSRQRGAVHLRRRRERQAARDQRGGDESLHPASFRERPSLDERRDLRPTSA